MNTSCRHNNHHSRKELKYCLKVRFPKFHCSVHVLSSLVRAFNVFCGFENFDHVALKGDICLTAPNIILWWYHFIILTTSILEGNVTENGYYFQCVANVCQVFIEYGNFIELQGQVQRIQADLRHIFLHKKTASKQSIILWTCQETGIS
jgi:hypothetical protein